jgi:hypothetical protein
LGKEKKKFIMIGACLVRRRIISNHLIRPVFNVTSASWWRFFEAPFRPQKLNQFLSYNFGQTFIQTVQTKRSPKAVDKN